MFDATSIQTHRFSNATMPFERVKPLRPKPERLLIDIGGPIGLGDILRTTPFIHAMVKNCPDTQIHLMGDETNLENVFGNWSGIDRLMPHDGKYPWSYHETLSANSIPSKYYDAIFILDHVYNTSGDFKKWATSYGKDVIVGLTYHEGKDFPEYFTPHIKCDGRITKSEAAYMIMEKVWGITVPSEERWPVWKPSPKGNRMGSFLSAILQGRDTAAIGFYLGSGDLIGKPVHAIRRFLERDKMAVFVESVMKNIRAASAKNTLKPVFIFGRSEEEQFYRDDPTSERVLRNGFCLSDLGLNELHTLASGLSMVISYDTGPAHLMRTTDTPLAVLVHHGVDKKIYDPVRDRMRLFESRHSALFRQERVDPLLDYDIDDLALRIAEFYVEN